MNSNGRQGIYTDVEEITRDNVIDVLIAALTTHRSNSADIQYLYDYYKGKQPILQRVKEYNAEICNKIVENRANEIVSFKVGYLMGEPVQYVTLKEDEEKSIIAAINRLNEYMFAEDKAAKDKDLAEWFTVCGTAYRLILPDKKGEEDEAPFEIYTLDPRNAFVVYSNGLGNKPMMGVRFVTKRNGDVVYSIYTKNKYFEITQNATTGVVGASTPLMPVPMVVDKEEDHIYGGVPIIEYPANNARLGAFEIVLPLLDSLNTVTSNRLDGVEQFIQALLVLKATNVSSDVIEKAKELGGLLLPDGADAKYLTQELNQTQTQTLINDLYQSVLVICGMPNRNGGSSTSDTGKAVIFRDGWTDAEARAKNTETKFKESEKQFLKLAINYVNTYRKMSLRLSTIDIRFTRRNYENIREKAQVLTMLLNNPKIHPRLAFEHCGMFVDPDLAYTESMRHYEEQLALEEKELEDDANLRTIDAQANAAEGA